MGLEWVENILRKELFGWRQFGVSCWLQGGGGLGAGC